MRSFSASAMTSRPAMALAGRSDCFGFDWPS